MGRLKPVNRAVYENTAGWPPGLLVMLSCRACSPPVKRCMYLVQTEGWVWFTGPRDWLSAGAEFGSKQLSSTQLSSRHFNQVDHVVGGWGLACAEEPVKEPAKMQVSGEECA